MKLKNASINTGIITIAQLQGMVHYSSSVLRHCWNSLHPVKLSFQLLQKLSQADPWDSGQWPNPC